MLPAREWVKLDHPVLLCTKRAILIFFLFFAEYSWQQPLYDLLVHDLHMCISFSSASSKYFSFHSVAASFWILTTKTN